MDLKEALKPDTQLLIKLGSLIVHYQEFVSAGGHSFDLHAIKSLEEDVQVKDWLDSMSRGALLPVKRSAK